MSIYYIFVKLYKIIYRYFKNTFLVRLNMDDGFYKIAFGFILQPMTVYLCHPDFKLLLAPDPH